MKHSIKLILLLLFVSVHVGSKGHAQELTISKHNRGVACSGAKRSGYFYLGK